MFPILSAGMREIKARKIGLTSQQISFRARTVGSSIATAQCKLASPIVFKCYKT